MPLRGYRFVAKQVNIFCSVGATLTKKELKRQSGNLMQIAALLYLI